MSEPVYREADLVAALVPLEPYMDQIVLCGGWTLFVYRRWVLHQEGPLPLRTGDVDVLIPGRLPVERPPLEGILKSAGFMADMTGSGPLPVIQYRKEGAPYIEFLTPRRSTREPDVVQIQPGVTAQVLQYLTIVLENTRDVAIPGIGPKVRVPTPAAYLYQKGLALHERQKESKRSKDLAYLFELLENFPELRPTLAEEMGKLKSKYSDGWWRTFKSTLKRYFSSIDGPGVDMILGQEPHPYGDLRMKDPMNARALFRRSIYNAFKGFQNDLP